jgi:hypothetical protein
MTHPWPISIAATARIAVTCEVAAILAVAALVPDERRVMVMYLAAQRIERGAAVAGALAREDGALLDGTS